MNAIDSHQCPHCQATVAPTADSCPVCGHRLHPHTESAIKEAAPSTTQIKLALSTRFEIQEEIGRGGMAIVFKAIQKNLNRLVALKVLPMHFTHDPEIVERFHREARAAAGLNHPHIVTVYDEGIENGIHYIAMEYIQGTDLRSRIEQQGPLPVEEVREWIAAIADGLGYAHQQGIIHRDIKSANILVDETGRAVLTDFGIALAMGSSHLTQVGTVMGTPEYMSPEQARGDTTDERSDIYSLGVVLYECFTAQLPFQTDTPLGTIHKITTDPPVPPREIRPDLPAPLENVVLRCLAKHPQERYPDCQSLIHALNYGEVKNQRKKWAKPQRRSSSQEVPFAHRGLPAWFVWAFSLLLTAILVVGGLLLWQEGYISLGSRTLSKRIMKDQTWRQLTALQQQRINALLDEADRLYILDHLVEPPGNNALELYRKVLRIHPTNKYALLRINLIKKDFIKQSRTLLKSTHNLQQANQVLQKALTYFPDDPLLLTAIRQNKIYFLEGQLQQALVQQHYFPPEQKNAWQMCKTLLELDNTNAVARDAWKKLQTLLIEKIQNLIKSAKFEEANHEIQQAQQLFPENGVFKLLPKQMQAAQLKALWQQAIHSGALVPPARPNAVSIYTQLAPLLIEEQEKRRFRQELKNQLMGYITSARENNQLEKAYQALKAARTVFADDPWITRQWEAVVPRYQQMVRHQKVTQHLNRAHQAIHQHQWRKALEAYQQVLKWQPNHPEARRAKEIVVNAVVQYGDELYAQGKFWAAQNQYFYALGLKPQDPLLKVKLAKAKEKLK